MIKTYVAAAPILKYRIAKAGATSGTVQPATAATDEAIGVTPDVGAGTDERCDLIHHGEGFVVAGGAIAFGKLFVAGAGGKAIQAAPAAGTSVRTIGMALEAAAADGDIIRAFIFPSVQVG